MKTNHDVPKGTVFRPLIFLLFINDFREKVQGNFDINQFTDDTSFHFSGDNVAELEKVFLKYWKKTNIFLTQNKLTMNIGKTELLYVSKKKKKNDPIVFQGQEIKPKSHCRYLGVMNDF